MPNWLRQIPLCPEALREPLLALINAPTPAETGQVVDQSKAILLTDAAIQALQFMIEGARREGLKILSNLEQKQRFLARARVLQNIQQVVEEEEKRKRHLDRVEESVLAFLAAEVNQPRQVFEQHQRVLRTIEAIGMAQRIVEKAKTQFAAQEVGKPWLHWRRELKVQYLEHAYAQGIDYAEQQYQQGLSDIIARMRSHYQGGSEW